ncbi:Rho termination factor [Flavobacterium sp. AC]|uniref:Rho termination factor n=1 Tax=Flavobacterium azizsancarii TaxID=2961580 RepID=A0ABT4WHT7_9FLAO|nr:Rho termination factor [Flavobacterium azizsancarii]MDA6072158.1 Rho termination factor [Flavobacterium azizsancarii]
MPDARIKNEKQYQALLEIGYSKEKAARIANTPDSGEKGGRAKPYDEWTKAELYEQAKKVGIAGRSYMSKKNLIHSLQNN